MQESCQFGEALFSTASDPNQHRIAPWLIKHTGNAAYVIDGILKQHQVHLSLSKTDIIFAHLLLQRINQLRPAADAFVVHLRQSSIQNHGKYHFRLLLAAIIDMVLEDFFSSPLIFESKTHELYCQLLEVVSVGLGIEPVHEYSLAFMHPQLCELVRVYD